VLKIDGRRFDSVKRAILNSKLARLT